MGIKDRMQDIELVFNKSNMSHERADSSNIQRISPSIIRFIKLGKGGQLEADCIEKGLCYIGFGTDQQEIFNASLKAAESDTEEAWESVGELLYNQERITNPNAKKGSSTRAKNQVKSFFTAGEETLWITFHAGKLHYAFLDETSKPELDKDTKGSIRKVKGEWRHKDTRGNVLSIDRLSGLITKTQIFRGTSCEIKGTPKAYLLRRINQEQHAYITTIEEARVRLEQGVTEAIRALSPDDFETLTELIFSKSLRRISKVGKTQKFVDMVFEDPLCRTGDEHAVQVKSETSIDQFLKYITKPDRKSYARFFYVFHKSKDLTEDYQLPSELQGDIQIIGPETLASLVVENGLISWVTNKSG